MRVLSSVILALGGSLAISEATTAQPDWAENESSLLSGHVQLTGRDRFVKAGEAYFDPTSEWIIFQAVPVPPEGEEPSPHYSMYVAKLTRDDDGGVSGIEEPIRVSPEGSANTCGWFHPTLPGMIMFGSTIVPPERREKPGFKVGSNRYVWQFPDEMEVVAGYVPQIAGNDAIASLKPEVKPVFERPNYDAECSWSPKGRYVLYAHVRDEPTEGESDADIWLHDLIRNERYPLVTADGYDGGPFFSPDGTWICYRSDRNLNDRLQLFIAELRQGEEGPPTGIEREIQVTDNEHVNWAPFWHPSGEFLIYATSEVGHHNYELFAVEVGPLMRGELGEDATPRKRRVSFAPGADILPAFNPDGTLLMWCGQRGPLAEGESRPSSQVWIAEVEPAEAWFPTQE